MERPHESRNQATEKKLNENYHLFSFPMLRGAEKWRKSENPQQIFAFWKARVRIWVGGEKHDKLRFYWINIEKKNCVKLSWDEQSRKSREINLFWCLIVCNNRINKCQVKKERQKFNSKNIKFVVVEVRKENTEKSHKNSDSLFCQKKRAPPPCERRSLAVERARKKWTWEIKYLPCHFNGGKMRNVIVERTRLVLCRIIRFVFPLNFRLAKVSQRRRVEMKTKIFQVFTRRIPISLNCRHGRQRSILLCTHVEMAMKIWKQ